MLPRGPVTGRQAPPVVSSAPAGLLRPQQRARLAVAASASAPPDAGDEDEDAAATTFPALLAGLAVALDDAPPGDGGATARAFAGANPAVTSLEFVAWLAAAEDRAPSTARPIIARAGALLTAVREGLDGAAFDAVQAAVADFSSAAAARAVRAGVRPAALLLRGGGQGGGEAAAAAATVDPAAGEGGHGSSPSPLSSSSDPSDAAMATQLKARWAALGAASAASALSPAGLAAGQAAADGLGKSMSRTRSATVAALLGRARLDSDKAAEAAAKAVAAAAAAGRVLAFLLEQPDAATRRALLADALEPAPEGEGAASGEGSSGDLEYISTTPLRLVQAIDLELTRLERAHGGGRGEDGEEDGAGMPFLAGLLPESKPAVPYAELEATLLDLRRAALDAWDEGNEVETGG